MYTGAVVTELDPVLPPLLYNSGMSNYPKFRRPRELTPEAREAASKAISEKAIARWNNQEYRDKLSAKLKAFWVDKENKKRMSAAAVASWEGRDDRRAIVSASVSARRRGVPLSSEHRAAIKAAMANVPYEIRHHLEPGTREKMSAAALDRPPMTDEQRSVLSQAQHEYQESFKLQRKASKRAAQVRKMLKWHSCQCKEDCTAIVKDPEKQYARGHHPNTVTSFAQVKAEAGNAWCPSPYSGIHGDVTMRSSWEVLYAVYLDCKGVDWKYEKTSFRLHIRTRTFTYTPDFYLPDTDEYIEVKGYFSPDAKSKMKLFKRQHPEVKVSMVFSSEIEEIRAYLSLPKGKAH